MNKKFERARRIFSERLGLDLTTDEVRFLLAKHGSLKAVVRSLQEKKEEWN